MQITINLAGASIISSLALVVAVAALAVTLASSQTQQHFHAYSECRCVVGHDGQKRDEWLFSAWRANTLVGNTIGRVFVAFASARFDRQERKRRAAAQ